jgi:hypothetical protein
MDIGRELGYRTGTWYRGVEHCNVGQGTELGYWNRELGYWNRELGY